MAESLRKTILLKMHAKKRPEFFRQLDHFHSKRTGKTQFSSFSISVCSHKFHFSTSFRPSCSFPAETCAMPTSDGFLGKTWEKVDFSRTCTWICNSILAFMISFASLVVVTEFSEELQNKSQKFHGGKILFYVRDGKLAQNCSL